MKHPSPGDMSQGFRFGIIRRRLSGVVCRGVFVFLDGTGFVYFVQETKSKAISVLIEGTLFRLGNSKGKPSTLAVLLL